MKTVKKHWLGAIAPLFFCFGAYCQNGTVAYNISTQPPVQYSGNEASVFGGWAIFTSAIAGNKYPSNSEKYTIDDMYYIDLMSLFKPSTSTRENTINAQRLGGVSKVVVKVFAYNFDKNTNGKGELIYQLEKNGDEPEHPVKVKFYYLPLNPLETPNNYSINSDNIKALLQNTKARDKFGNIISIPSSKTQYAFNLFPYLADLSDNDLLEYTENQKILNKTDGKIPVIVEVEVTQAKVNEITVPGLNKPVYLGTFNPDNQLSVEVFVNKETVARPFSNSPNNNAPLQLNMGDEVNYVVSLPKNSSSNPPEIKGMPKTWLANFAVESMYYCTPSATPGEFNPWIGFDSNVHGAVINQYPTALSTTSAYFGEKIPLKNGGSTNGEVFDNKTFELRANNWEAMTPLPNNFVKGVDVSYITEIENGQSNNKLFYDNDGNPQECFKMMEMLGANAVRLRAFVEPKDGWCGTNDLLVKAKRAKDQGLDILIDFHLSDDFADPSKQTLPRAWGDWHAPFITIKEYMKAYINDVLLKLKTGGITPKWVQIGNEIGNGMLWPHGKTVEVGKPDEQIQWQKIADLISLGNDAVKDVFKDTKVVVHLANGTKGVEANWFLTGIKKDLNPPARYDIIGLTSYILPSNGDWQANNNQLLENMNQFVKDYGKEVMVVETGISRDRPEAKAYLTDLMNKVASVKDSDGINKGLGVFWWEPIAYDSSRFKENDKFYPTFDDKGKTTGALDSFKSYNNYAKNSTTTNPSWILNWTAERQMDASKTDYVPSKVWKQTKKLKPEQALVLPDGTTTLTQRNNQREGLAMELLRQWKKWNINNSYSYTNKEYDGPNYLTGLDADEVIFLKKQDLIKPTDTKIAIRQETEPWKFFFPLQQDSIAVRNMVTAYRRNREAVLNNKVDTSVYDGYEIQDIGTDENNPNGTGKGNNTAPGQVVIKKDGYKVVIPIQVNSPLNGNKGFYGAIEGPQWPTIGEKNVEYTLNGLKDLDLNELNKFCLVLRSQNTGGSVFNKVRCIKDLDINSKIYISNQGIWKQKFDFDAMGGTGYYTLTAFYQQPGNKPVMVAGKELLETKLRFTYVVNPSKDKNKWDDDKEGAYIYDNEYRDQRGDDSDIAKQTNSSEQGEPTFKYLKKFAKTYTIRLGEELDFTTLDSDPHTFKTPDPEWYLSERTKAKRIDLEDPNNKAKLAYYLDKLNDKGDVESVSLIDFGQKTTISPRSKGAYQLRVVYRNNGNLLDENYVFCKINVIDYPNNNLGTVVFKNLTENQKKYLNIPNGNNIVIGEVKDVYSDYMYTKGPRANDSVKDRFEKFNGYANEYDWNLETYQEKLVTNEFVDNYNTKDWFPETWVRHIDRSNRVTKLPIKDLGIPGSYTTTLDEQNSLIGGLFPENIDVNKRPFKENWQVRLPWISITEYSGPRIRTNIKVIYNLKNFFDNSTGAFSGNPGIPLLENLQFKLRTDDQMDMDELYWDLKRGRKKLYRADVLNQKELIVMDGKTRSTVIYKGQVPGLPITTKPAAKQASKALSPEAKPEGLAVYPNPNAGQFNVSWENPAKGPVSITLFSLNGAAVFSKKEQVPAGKNTGFFDTGGALPTGVYILKIVGNGFEATTKVAIKSD